MLLFPMWPPLPGVINSNPPRGCGAADIGYRATMTTRTVTAGTLATGTLITGTLTTRAEPTPPAALDRALARAFALLGRLRGGRAVHGRGEAWHGELRVPAASRSSDVGGTERWGAPLLDEPGTHAVLVRRSRALGLPSWLPDVTGVAIRVLDAGGTGLHQDLLLDTGGSSVIGRRVPTVHLAGHEQHYSSLLTWQAGSGKVMFGLEPPVRRACNCSWPDHLVPGRPGRRSP